MSALARTTESDCYTRAANEDCVNGGLRTRTKYAYDANGNVSARNGSIIGWTSYNYPSGVTTSTESATFDYGPDRQRWRMIYTGPSGTETTYYISPQFEVVHTSSGTEYRHYISANGRPVMVIGRTTAYATNFRSLQLDNQGSISTIVNAQTAASYATESFTAYGNRREASTWSGAPTSAERATMDGVTREGYTFQTVLGSMGLNHMNGRIEDAVTGRFLSPDPRGTIPGNTQSWNRYSYVMNNPLTNVDPTGFSTLCGGPNNCIINNFSDGNGFSHAMDPNFGAWVSCSGSGCISDFSSQTDAGSNVSAGAGDGRTPETPSASATVEPTVSTTVPPNPSPDVAVSDPAQSRSCGDCTGTDNAFNDPNAFDLNSGPIIDTSRGPGVGKGSALDGNYLSVAAITDMASEVTTGLSAVASFVEATVSSAAEFAHSFGVAGLAFGTATDFISLKNNGISQTQFNVNLGVGAAGLAGGALTVLPASQYFIAKWFYDHFYPGGSQQGFQDWSKSLNDISSNGME